MFQRENTATSLETRRGLTLVDLVVTLCVGAVALALILPAMCASHNADRQVHCLQNMREVALAVMGYTAANAEEIPVGIYKTSRFTAQSVLLPFLEVSSVYQNFDRFQGTADSSSKATKTRLPIYLCPDDDPKDTYKSPGGGEYARSNFVFNFGSDTMQPAAKTSMGALRFGAASSFAEIKDGLSNTVLLSETIAGKDAKDPSGAWGYGEAGSCGYTHKNLPVTGKGVSPTVGKSASDFSNAVATASSMHGGVVNVVFADTHTARISEKVDLRAWQAMGTAAGGEAFSAE